MLQTKITSYRGKSKEKEKGIQRTRTMNHHSKGENFSVKILELTAILYQKLPW